MADIEIRLFDPGDIPSYKELLADYELSLDIYYQPEFLALEAQNMAGELEIFTVVQKSSRKVFIYPYIKLPLEGEFAAYSDLTSPYGYAGPYCNDVALFNTAESEFLAHVSTKNIVTEFVRYHFRYNRELKFSQGIENVLNRRLVVIDLTKDWDEIWMKDMSMNNRNYVRKLEKEGFQFEMGLSPEALEDFIGMYYQMMDHVQAPSHFYFPDEYFSQLSESLEGKIELARIVKDGVTYSTVLFFACAGFVHLYLMGRHLDFLKVPATNLLYTKVAEWAKGQGYHSLNIGGGRTGADDDSLFRFKKNFSHNILPFIIGKRIHRADVYQALIDQFQSLHGREKYQEVRHVLQFYRAQG